MQEPLKENLPYLKARMGNLAGKVYKDCMSTANCAYVQDIKRCGVKPTFIG